MKKMKTNKIKLNISILNKFKSFKFSDKNLIKEIFYVILSNSDVANKVKNLFPPNLKDVSIDFVFCSDDEIKVINCEYRNIDKPTDVISFALFADDNNHIFNDQNVHLGEIIISPETAKRQAKGSLEDEISTLITHGILHLLGFDHQNETDYNFIVGIQNYVLEELKNGKI